MAAIKQIKAVSDCSARLVEGGKKRNAWLIGWALLEDDTIEPLLFDDGRALRASHMSATIVDLEWIS